jgi:hypothetical protein
VTGNVIAGRAKLAGRPVMMRFADASVREALLMGPRFDPRRGEKTKIGMSPGVAARFLGEVNDSIVEDERTGAMVERHGERYTLTIPNASKGSDRRRSTRPYYTVTGPAVGLSFTQRRGDEAWQAHTNADVAAQVLDSWVGLEASLQSGNNHDRARELVRGAAGRFAIRPGAYSRVPDQLMGFSKDPSRQKGYGDQPGYKHAIVVRVSWPDGVSMLDGQRGMNREHALERARRNWEDATITFIRDGELDGGSYAIRPTADELERIRGFARKARRKGEGTRIGRSPNPIAGTSDDPKIRALQRGVREERAPGEEVQSRESQRDLARTHLQADPDGVKASLMAKIDAGDTLNSWEIEASRMLFVEGAFQGLRRGATDEEYADAVELSWAYQDARRDQARALGQIRDPLKKRAMIYDPASTSPTHDPDFTPRERVAWAILQQSRDIRRKIGRLRREAAKPTTTAGRSAQIKGEIRRLLLTEARRVKLARERLEKAGFPPDLLVEDYFDDPVLWARIARIISTSKSGIWDWYIEYSLAAMLSGPLTHKANFVGNVAHAAWEQHMKRLAEAAVNVVARDPDSATFGEEAYALYKGFLPGFFQGVHNFFMAYRTELPVYEVDLARKGVSVGEWGTKVDSLHGPAIPGKLGQILRAPSLTTLLAFDELVKTWVGVMEGNALAYRQARKEGLKGESAATRIREILDDPTHPVHGQALLKAKVVAFQAEKGPITNLVMQARAVADELLPGGFPLGTTLLPFVQTPAGIFRVGLESVFQPFRAIFRLASGRYRGNREEFVRDMGHTLLSVAAWGAVMALVFGDDDDGLPLISGSGSPRFDERALEWRTVPPYSIRVFGEYRDYRRVEPAAVTIATLVDIGLAAKTALQRGDQDAASDAMGRLFSSVGDQMKDKTFLRTVGEVYEAVFNRDRNTKLAPRLMRDVLFTRMVPNIIKQPLRQTDPFVRSGGIRAYEDRGIWEAALRSTGFESAPSGDRPDAPPPRFDLWGRPLRRFGEEWSPVGRFVYDLVSPAPTRSGVEVADLDLLLLRYNDRVARGEFEDAKPFYGRPPDFWFRKDEKTHYWSDEEYAELSQRSGQMAAERLRRAGLDFEKPTPDDVKRIADELARARRVVRSSLQSKHFQSEPSKE